MTEPKITVETDVLVLTSVKVELPEFELTVDEGDGTDIDGDRDYVGVFETADHPHTVNLYGPTPEHVVGLGHLYASKLTGGLPYTLVLHVDEEIPAPQLP